MKNKNRSLPFIIVIAFSLVALAAIIAMQQVEIVSNIIAGGCDYTGKEVRSLYFDCDTQKTMFSELPEMPEDFYATRNLFLYRFITFTEKILDEAYWKQPEWFPNFDKEGGLLDSIKNYIEQSKTSGKWGVTVWCAGIYPSDFYAKTRAGRNITVYTWIRNAPHQSKYEGIRLVEAYPACDSFEEAGFELGNNTACQDPEYAREHIKLSTIEPNLFILTPNFPAFTTNHTRIIRVDLEISGDISPGRYVVGFDTNLPPEEFSQQYYEKFGFDYTGSAKEFHCSPGPQYRLFIDIEQ